MRPCTTLLTLAAFVVALGPQVVASAPISSGSWQVHEGPAARHNFGRTVPDGDLEAYLSGADVPDASASGWSSASSAGLLVWSGPGGTPCRAAANYTYFQTSLRPAPGARYELAFLNVDDAARVSTIVGTGTFHLPQLVGLRQKVTIDLTPALDPGVDNRIVITLADVCGAGNSIRAELRRVGERDAMPAPQPTATPLANADLSGTYRMKTMGRGATECLEGNQASSPNHDGAAFMDRCQSVGGQVWNIVRAGPNSYRLKTAFRGPGECLEGNSSESPRHSGGAFMDSCQNVTGQLWNIVPDAGGSYRLKTMNRDAACLEGNAADSPAFGGRAFMDKCQNVTGQLWKLERQGGAPAPARQPAPVQREPQPKPAPELD